MLHEIEYEKNNTPNKLFIVIGKDSLHTATKTVGLPLGIALN